MEKHTPELIRQRLIEAGGRMSQDLGLGRITGQTLVYLYLSREECSLDEIGEQLQLSKASISIAARQLERLGMIVRVWKGGDRKSYYRTADNFTQSLQKGVIEFVNQKIQIVSQEIDNANMLLEQIYQDKNGSQDLNFLNKRLKRAMHLRDKVLSVINNPIIKKLSK